MHWVVWRDIYQCMRIILLFIIFTTAYAQTLDGVLNFYAQTARQVKITFNSKIEVTSKYALTLALLNEEGKAREKVENRVDDQIKHLVGYFQSESFKKKYKTKAAMGDQYKIKFTKVTKLANSYLVNYSFDGRGVIDKALFTKAKAKFFTIDIKLPRNPKTIYDQGVVAETNPCTDEEYNSEEDFFYFWDIELPGCPLKKLKSAVVVTKAKIQLLNFTKESYPEYDKLYAGKKDIFIFLGYLGEKEYAEVDYNDSAYKVFKQVSSYLKEHNFELVQREDEFSGNLFDDESEIEEGGNLYRKFKAKVVTSLGTTVKWNVHLLLSDPSFENEDETFRDMYAYALEHGSIIAYDGHSGLGANLDLEILPDFDFNQLPYQLMFINGCSSYTYFKNDYIEAKSGGTKNLDIITSGTSTLDTTSFDNLAAFLTPLITGKKESFQTIMRSMEESNGEEESYLTAVIGDDDNVWMPSR